jgi:DNA-binding transcriptional LysR family regulator
MDSRAIDLDTVRAFVLVADLASFTRAAEALETSQASVSLKLKRLEDRLGCRVLERTPRRVRLSPEGEAFLPSARDLLSAHERALAALTPNSRRLSLGISDHVAGPELPNLLARLAAYDPALVIEVRIAASRDLVAGFDRGEFDAVLFRREGERLDGAVLAQERLGWFAAPTWRRRSGEPLRLATLAAPCGLRAAATQALDRAGVAWLEVFVGGGVMAVGAAVTAGLGVAALAHRVAPAGTVEVGEALGLPALPPSDVVLGARRLGPRESEALRIVAAAFRAAVPR